MTLPTASRALPRRGSEVLDAWTFWSEGGSLADRAEWLGVLQDLARLGHRRIQRPMLPLDDMSAVDPLSGPVLFPGDKRLGD